MNFEINDGRGHFFSLFTNLQLDEFAVKLEPTSVTLPIYSQSSAYYHMSEDHELDIGDLHRRPNDSQISLSDISYDTDTSDPDVFSLESQNSRIDIDSKFVLS